MPLLAIYRSKSIKILLQNHPSYCIFEVALFIIQVQHCPSDQTTAPSETRIKQHEMGFLKGFPPKPSSILASSTCGTFG
jgi:hypothetical protein